MKAFMTEFKEFVNKGNVMDYLPSDPMRAKLELQNMLGEL